MRKIHGALGRFRMQPGLLVAWGGLSQVGEREIRQQSSQVRMWAADDVLRELFAVHGKLPSEIQAELPLKRIWTLADEEE